MQIRQKYKCKRCVVRIFHYSVTFTATNMKEIKLQTTWLLLCDSFNKENLLLFIVVRVIVVLCFKFIQQCIFTDWTNQRLSMTWHNKNVSIKYTVQFPSVKMCECVAVALNDRCLDVGNMEYFYFSKKQNGEAEDDVPYWWSFCCCCFFFIAVVVNFWTNKLKIAGIKRSHAVFLFHYELYK